MNLETINIFWTGGWDSTFRVLELSDKNIIIQPFYLRDNRKSEMMEINTVKNLTEAIKKLPNTKCILKPLLIKKVSDIDKDEQITKSFNNLKNLYKEKSNGANLGSQYEWLARFSKNINYLELGIEKDSKPQKLINIFGQLEKKQEENLGEFYILDKQNSTEDLINVFGSYRYPLLSYSKLDMQSIALQKGYINIMNKTWFCHRPKNNQPCGKCAPCMQTIESGLKSRFTKSALIRYKIKKKLKLFSLKK
ncbi:conserved hypothetical protein [Tenacibaculum sediminilitoris]|uniref:hypothetical protein n=1 Tax=Tenacibaculum sediminilitoris TaxID=1820334 RepID=UPI0038941752